MEFYANLPMPLAGHPADWAREREAEGCGWVPDPVEVQLVHDPRMQRSSYDE